MSVEVEVEVAGAEPDEAERGQKETEQFQCCLAHHCYRHHSTQLSSAQLPSGRGGHDAMTC